MSSKSSHQISNRGKSNHSELKSLLPILLAPIVLLLLLPREHSGKLALTALVLTVLFAVLAGNLRHFGVKNGSTPAKLVAALALAMPILTIGGCMKYTFLNSTSNHQFVLFNGSDQPMEIIFDGKTIHLQSRQAVEKTLFSDKLLLTDPGTGQTTEMAFPEGLHIIAYGASYELKVTELDYRRMSFSSSNYGGGTFPSSRRVRNSIFSMRGDFWVYMPGEKVPRTISRPSHSSTRYLSLSVENSQFHPDRPRSEDEIMKDAVQRAMEKTMESK